MTKIFVDKMLMEKIAKHPVKIVGISLNDIQRKNSLQGAKTSYTFVLNLFIGYTNILTRLDGYYYFDLPKKAKEAPFNQHIFRFWKFI